MEKLFIAKKIKKIRAEQKLNLREVGGKANLTPAVISMIENAKISPTLATLHKILVALGTNFGDFFSEDKEPTERFHFPKKEMKRVTNKKRRYTIVLPRRKDIKMQVLFEEIFPGEKSETETHQVDMAGIIRKGGPLKLEIIGKGEELIYEGDAFYVSAGSPHKGSNTGKNKLEMITCYYPARY